jgi:hypothetical protein
LQASTEILADDGLIIPIFIDTINSCKIGEESADVSEGWSIYTGVHTMTTKNERVIELQKQIEELKQRWPAHSVPPAMLQQLDALDTELEDTLRSIEEADKNAGESE